MLNFVKILATTLIFGITSSAVLADPLDDISAYFNSFSTLQSEFTQHNADGTVSTGDFYMLRPGKMRMEYDDNGDGALLLVSAGSVAIFDRKSNDHATQYPLSRTPLGPILARNVDLKRAKLIDGVDAHQQGISVFASDPDHPEYGVGRFGFSTDPLRLQSWTMTNDMGETTHIVFEDEMRMDHKLSTSIFSIEREKEKRNPRGDR
jgi:outer membrane lipoprotein-sorting protein